MAAISLCMIVKDEEEVLGRCLESVRPLVDEIVVVDTGSRDATADCAVRHGAAVYSMTWDDDFAEARNFSFSKATCPYILWLDADDVVLPAELDKLLRLKARLDKDIYYLRYDYAQDEWDNSLCLLYRERLVRNTPALRWHHPVHECLLITSEMSAEQADITITHRRTPAGLRSDQNRNLRILKRAVTKPAHAESPRLRYYLAREYQDAGMDEEAAAAYDYFLRMEGGWAEDRIGAQQRLAECYHNLSRKLPGRASEYRNLARLAAKAAREMDDRWAEPYFLLGHLAFDEQDFTEAVFWYEKALRPPPPVLSPLRTFCYELGPAVQLCLCYDRLGDYARAYEYNERALLTRPDDAGLLYNRDYLRAKLAGETAADTPLKLDFGGRDRLFGDYLKCDDRPRPGVDRVFPLARMPYGDGSVAAIHCQHALEHLPHAEAAPALAECFRVLRPGGELFLRLPDLEACCRGFLQARDEPERERFRAAIYGPRRHGLAAPPAGRSIQAGFTQAEALAGLEDAGFIVDCYGKYDDDGVPSLAVRAVKPVGGARVGWVGGWQDIRNPQYRIRVYHVNRWLRSRGYLSEVIDTDGAESFETLVFFRRFDRQECELMGAARARGQRVILDLCEDLFDLEFEWYRPMIAAADEVVCCSHALAEKVRRYNPRVTVIEDAVEVDFSLNCAYEERDGLRVAWVGMGGNARHAESLRRMIEGLGHTLVTIHEHAGADIPWELSGWQQELARCDVAIAPLDERLQPSKSNNKVTAYMALGLPTIASPLDAYLRVITDGVNGFIARSESDWREHLERLRAPALRREVGQAGKSAARGYHLDVIAGRWAELLNGTPSPAPVVDVIIPTCGYSPYLKLCVESVVACTRLPHRILVVNSGDAEGIRQLPAAAHVVQAESPLSYAQAVNLGVGRGQAPYVCFLNDDVIVSEGWLEPLLAQLRAGAGLCNPLSNCDRGWLHDYELNVGGVPLLPGMNTIVADTIQLKGRDEPGVAPEQIHAFRPGKSRVYERDWVAFYCTLVSRELIERVGLLDEDFVNGCEDLDYCKRATAMGYTCRVDERSFVFHFGGVSRSRREEAAQEQYRAEDQGNHRRVAAKYERPLLVIHTGHAYEPWTSEQIDRGGIGGAETAASRMAEEVAALGYRAVVFSPCAGAEGTYRGVEYLDTSRFPRFVEMNRMAVFVASRYANLLDFNIRAGRKYLWAHDVWAMGTSLGSDDRVRRHYQDLDAIFCLSPWHRDFFAETHGVDKAKLLITGNGVDPARFERPLEKQPCRFIYSSSPDRGLDTLLDLFPHIRREFPQAELHIFYGFENWDKSIALSGNPAQQQMRSRISAAMSQPGVFFRGRVGQQRLAEEFLRSDVWFYPTRFTETYCITALEAQMAGAVCVCTDLAALSTTVGDRGVLIPGDAYTEEYRRRAVNEVLSLLSDGERKASLAAKAKRWAAQQTWHERARQWASIFDAPTRT